MSTDRSREINDRYLIATFTTGEPLKLSRHSLVFGVGSQFHKLEERFPTALTIETTASEARPENAPCHVRAVKLTAEALKQLDKQVRLLLTSQKS